MLTDTQTRVRESLPPHDIEAEMALVASLCIGDAAVRAAIRATVCRDDFFQADHQIMFDVVCDLIDADKPVDTLTLRAELDRRGLLAEIGGTPYLAQILGSVPSHHHGDHYAEIVRERAMRRRIIEVAADLTQQAYLPPKLANGDEIAQHGAERLSKLMATGRAAEYWTLADAVQEFYEGLERKESPLLTTGYAALDVKVGGVGEGETVIIAARPSMGKSTLLRQMAVRIAKREIPVGFISLEESSRKIARNVLSAECQIENRKLRAGNLCQEEWEPVAHGVAALSKLPFYGSKTCARRIQDIRALVTQWVSRHGIKVLFLDYLQLVRAYGEKRYEEVTNASMELTQIVKDFGLRAFFAAQLNRGVEGRDDKRPSMRDLRESGQIEQDADGIIFLHREDYYHIADQNYFPDHKAELIVAKFRDSARGDVVTLGSDLRYQTFTDIEQAPEVHHFRPPTMIQDPFADEP